MSSFRTALALSLTALTLAITACGAAPEPPAPASDDGEEPWGDELRKKTDASIKREIEQATAGTNFTSESDYPFKLVSASLPDNTRTITEAMVRDKLAWVIDHDEDADKPLATLHAQTSTWKDWKASYANCEAEEEGHYRADCEKTRAMNEALGRNLRGIKVFYFGASGSPGNVDGVGVSLIIVGRTPKNNLVGVRTIAIWT